MSQRSQLDDVKRQVRNNIRDAKITGAKDLAGIVTNSMDKFPGHVFTAEQVKVMMDDAVGVYELHMLRQMER